MTNKAKNQWSLLILFACIFAFVPLVHSQSTVQSQIIYKLEDGKLIAYSLSSGKKVWTFGKNLISIESKSGEEFYYRGDIILTTNKDTVFCLSAHSGKLKWKRILAEPFYSSAFARNTLTFSFSYSKLYSLIGLNTEDGTLLWYSKEFKQKIMIEGVFNTVIITTISSDGAYIRTQSAFFDLKNGIKIRDYADYVSRDKNTAFFQFSYEYLGNDRHPPINVGLIDFDTGESRQIYYDFSPRKNCGSEILDPSLTYTRLQVQIRGGDLCGAFIKTYSFEEGTNPIPVFTAREGK